MRRCIGWADRTSRYAVTAAIEEQGMASAHNDTFSFSGLWRFERIVSGDQDKGQLWWFLFYLTISIGFLTLRPIGWCCAVKFLCELNIQTRHRVIPILQVHTGYSVLQHSRVSIDYGALLPIESGRSAPCRRGPRPIARPDRPRDRAPLGRRRDAHAHYGDAGLGPCG